MFTLLLLRIFVIVLHIIHDTHGKVENYNDLDDDYSTMVSDIYARVISVKNLVDMYFL